MIKNISIKNFKSIAEQTIDLRYVFSSNFTSCMILKIRSTIKII